MTFVAAAELDGNPHYDSGMTLDYGDTIGGRIHWLRKNKHMRINEIAERLGVRSSHLSDVENNKGGMSVNLLTGLATILGTTTDFLLLRTDNPELPGGTEGKIVVDVGSEQERALLEEWIETVQDMTPEQRRALLDGIRVILNPPPPRIIGG